MSMLGGTLPYKREFFVTVASIVNVYMFYTVI